MSTEDSLKRVEAEEEVRRLHTVLHGALRSIREAIEHLEGGEHDEGVAILKKLAG